MSESLTPGKPRGSEDRSPFFGGAKTLCHDHAAKMEQLDSPFSFLPETSSVFSHVIMESYQFHGFCPRRLLSRFIPAVPFLALNGLIDSLLETPHPFRHKLSAGTFLFSHVQLLRWKFDSSYCRFFLVPSRVSNLSTSRLCSVSKHSPAQFSPFHWFHRR